MCECESWNIFQLRMGNESTVPSDEAHDVFRDPELRDWLVLFPGITLVIEEDFHRLDVSASGPFEPTEEAVEVLGVLLDSIWDRYDLNGHFDRHQNGAIKISLTRWMCSDGKRTLIEP